MTKNIEDIMQDIRDLRDADFHVCNYSKWQSNGEPNSDEDITCSCVEFDNVIDKLQKLIERLPPFRDWIPAISRTRNYSMAI